MKKYNNKQNFRSSNKKRTNRKKSISDIDINDLIKEATVAKKVQYVSAISYPEMPLNGQLKSNLKEKGISRPTQIQEESIPALLEGKNLIGIANTGTGKTAAFLIPIIEQMIANKKSTQALIIVPTRELALQVEQEFKELSKGLRLSASCFIGGTSVNKDINRLRNRQDLIIGTPGRLLDLQNQRALNLTNTSILVIDEFDKMFDMGFISDVKKLTSAMKNRKQTMLFSATLDKKQEDIIKSMIEAPVRVQLSSGNSTTDHIHQDIIRVKAGEDKFNLLRQLLNEEGFDKILVFAETKRLVDKISKKLNQNGVLSDQIHGNKSQNYRNLALNKFKLGDIKVLVATDVAARGIDVSDVSHVINYQLPSSLDSYIHRIGRTGRAGKSGQAFTFIEETTNNLN
ncbi:MAG: RNA helicase [Flavobacteriales bacterium]|nr:RNA helicase [Flavobacteriales bacterium]|tara:strand:- start:2698 stop:3897 length:1200 start_codon:yes stop_codon:yes gene_type:complete